MNTIFKNLLKAIGIMGYFIVLNFAYTRMNTDRLMNDIEVFSGIFLILGLIMLERAYKKDDGKIALSGVELLCISMHSLSIKHVIAFYQYDFRFYLLTSSYVFAIYYVLKSIIIYTRKKAQYLKNLSDISEIVKEEPIKKEAKKRRKAKNSKQKQEEIKIKEVKEKQTNNEEKEIKVKAKEETKKQTQKEESKKNTKKAKSEKKDKTKKENKDENKRQKVEKLDEEKTKKKKSSRKKKEVVDND